MDFEAVGWRPSRRLRHVTAVRLHNLYDPTMDGPASYFYELHTWNAQRQLWIPFYRSEQLPTNYDLDWERQLLDPESETALQGFQHRPDVGPLCLRVFAAGGSSTSISPNSTHLRSGGLQPAFEGTDAAACVLSHEPSDYNAQHLPRQRRGAEHRKDISDGSAIYEPQTTQPPPQPQLPWPPAWHGRRHGSNIGDGESMGGDSDVTHRFGKRLKPDSASCRTVPCGKTASQKVVSQLWGEVSGPGPPIMSPDLLLQHPQPEPLDSDAEATIRGKCVRDCNRDNAVEAKLGGRGSGLLTTTSRPGNPQKQESGKQEREHGDCQQREETQVQDDQKQDNAEMQVLRGQNGKQLGCEVPCGRLNSINCRPASASGAAVTAQAAGPGGTASSGSNSGSRGSDFGTERQEVSARLRVSGGSPASCEAVEALVAAAYIDGAAALPAAATVDETSENMNLFPQAVDPSGKGLFSWNVRQQQEQEQQLLHKDRVRETSDQRGQGCGSLGHDSRDKAAVYAECAQMEVSATGSSPTPSSSSTSCSSGSLSSDTEGAAAVAIIAAAAEEGAAAAAGDLPAAEEGAVKAAFLGKDAVRDSADNAYGAVHQASEHLILDGNLCRDDSGAVSKDDDSPQIGKFRILLECVFELSELVPLETRMLRQGWYTNLPVLFMEPDRQPFVPSSALPPPPPVPPQPLQPRDQPAMPQSGLHSGGNNGAAAVGRWRFGAAPVHTSAVFAGNGRAGAGAAAAGYRGSSSPGEAGQPGERPTDDKRALLRWLLSSSSVVQPLEAAGSLEEELQDESFLVAAAEAAEAAAAATGGSDGGRPVRSPAQLGQSDRFEAKHHHHHRSLSAADAAALLDPGPAPGFLPSALAVLFRQEWPRAVSGTCLPGQRSPVVDAPGSATGPELCQASGRVSPVNRRVASTPSMAAVGEAEAQGMASASGSEAVAGHVVSEARRPVGGAAVVTRRSLLRRSGTSAEDLVQAFGGEGVDQHMETASTASSIVSYAAAGAAAASPASMLLGSCSESQVSLTGLAAAAGGGGWRMASSQALASAGLDEEAAGGQQPWLSTQLKSTSASSFLQSTSSSQVALGKIGGADGGTYPATKPSARDFHAHHSTLPGSTAAGSVGKQARAPPQRPEAEGKSHHHDHTPLLLGAPSSAFGPASGVQRLCELVEVRASIRKLTQLQERLSAARASALAMRQRLEAAAARRNRLDEARARAEVARAEGRGWAVRGALAEGQLRDMRASAAKWRRDLLDRVRALETVTGVLQAAEQRRLSAEEQLAGPSGRGQLTALTAALVGRRNRLVSELGRIFQIGPVSEALLEPDPLDLALDSSWAGGWGRCAGLQREGTGQEPQAEAVRPEPSGIQSVGGDDGQGRPEGGQRNARIEGVTMAGPTAASTATPSPTSTGAVGTGRIGGGEVLARGGPTRLAVVGLELPPDLIERSLQGSAGWSPLDLGRRYDSDQRTAAGLGYLAAMVDLAAAYLGVPLRYPIAPRVSVSYISDPIPPSVSIRSGAVGPMAGGPPTLPQASGSTGSAAPALSSAAPGAEWRLLSIATGSLSYAAAAVAAATTGPSPPSPPPAVGLIPGPRGVGVEGRLAVFSSLLHAQLDPRVAATPAGATGDDAHPAGLNPAAGLPLFWGDGARDRTRFAYAVYLLSKDVEQLLAAHGIPAVAPNQPLPNLYVLITAAASGVPRRAESVNRIDRATAGDDT